MIWSYGGGVMGSFRTREDELGSFTEFAPELAGPVGRNWAVRPGEILAEWMSEHKMSAADMAKECSMTEVEITGLLSGKLRIGNVKAAKLSVGTGIEARFWLNAERVYRQQEAK